MGEKKVTMNDVAQAVGVSRTAVSFVLNGRAAEKGISPDLARRIADTARRLNYRPSLLARGLTGQKTMVVGVVLPSVSSAYGPELVREVEARAQTAGYQIMVGQHENSLETLNRTLEGFLGRHVDGLIVSPVPGLKDLPTYREIRRSGVPVVFVDRDPGDDDASVVTNDSARAVELAVLHLAKLGHTRIAMYDAPRELRESRLREGAYRETLAELGLPFDESLLRIAAWNEEPGLRQVVGQVMKELLSLPDAPTGMVAISSNRAIAVYESAAELGCRIPGDLSLVALTGFRFDDFHRARITSVQFSYEKVGWVAVRLLLDAMAEESAPPVHTYVIPRLVPGDTCAALKKIRRGSSRRARAEIPAEKT